MPKGKYRYQVVENEGTDLEFVCRTFDQKKDAEAFIDELYEPEDFGEMTVAVRRVLRKKHQRTRPDLPPGTSIVMERYPSGQSDRDNYRYIACAGDTQRSFSRRPAAARWLNANCPDHPGDV